MKRVFAILAILFLLLTGILVLMEYTWAPGSGRAMGAWLPAWPGKKARAADLAQLLARQAARDEEAAAPKKHPKGSKRSRKPLRAAEPLRDPFGEPPIRQAAAERELETPEPIAAPVPDERLNVDENATAAPADTTSVDDCLQAPASEVGNEAARDAEPDREELASADEPTPAGLVPLAADEPHPTLVEPGEMADENGIPQAPRHHIEARDAHRKQEHHARRDSRPHATPRSREVATEPVDEDLPRAETAPVAEPDHLPVDIATSSEIRDIVSLRWATPKEVNVGQAVACQLIVHNSSDAAVEGVVVRAVVPKHVEFQQANPEPRRDEREVTWALGAMTAGETKTVEIELTPMAEGEVTPVALVTFTRATSARIQVSKAKLHLAIEGPEEAVVGEAAVYQFLVENTGTVRAQNIVVTTDLDELLRAGSQASPSYRLGTLEPGESRRVQVTTHGTEPGRAVIAGRVFVGNSEVADAHVEAEIISPRLELAIEGPRLRYIDRPAVYTIHVHNPSEVTVNNVQLVEMVPAGCRFLDANAGGTFDSAARQVAWFLGSLPPGETAEVALHLAASEPGDNELTAEVRADAGVTATAQTATRVEGISMVTLEIVDTDDPVEIDGETTYEMRVTNRGSCAAERVQLAAKLPDTMDAVDAQTGPTDGHVDGRQIVFEAIRKLEPGKTETYRVRVHCREAGQVGFRGYFRTAEHQQPVIEEEVTRVYQD